MPQKRRPLGVVLRRIAKDCRNDWQQWTPGERASVAAMIAVLGGLIAIMI